MINPTMLRLLAQLRDEARPLSRASLCLDCDIDDADFDATMAAAREHLAIDDLERIVAVAGGRDAGSRYKIEPLPRPTDAADGSGWARGEFDAGGFPRCVPAVEAVTDEDCYPKCTKHPRRPHTATGDARAAEVVLSHADAVDRAQRGAEGREELSDDAMTTARTEGFMEGSEGFARMVHDTLTAAGVPRRDGERPMSPRERIEWLAKQAQNGDGERVQSELDDAHDEGMREVINDLHHQLDRLGVPRVVDVYGTPLGHWSNRVDWLADRAKTAQGAGTYPAIQPDPRDDDAAKVLDEIDAPKAATIAERIRLFADDAEGRIEFWRKQTRDAADRYGDALNYKDKEILQLRAGRDALIDAIERHQQTIDRLRADVESTDDTRPLVRLVDSLFDDDELIEIIESEFSALRDIIERGKR